MEEFWVLIFVSLFVINSLNIAESVKVKLEETPLKTFDGIFGEDWWDRDEAEDLKRPVPTNFGQNVSGQIDRQNTQIGQIEPNSTDQLGQIEPNSTDQNPPLTESDHSDNANSNENITEDEQKRKIIVKFHAFKNEFKQKGKYSAKEWNQIDGKIAKHLKVNRKEIYKWKKGLGLSRKTGPNYSDDEKHKIVKKLMQIKSDNSGEGKKSCKEIDKEIAERFGVNVRTINQWKKKFGLSRKNPKNDRNNLIEKFDQMKAELKRAGLKSSYKHEIDKTVAKELGLSVATIYIWKSELGQTAPNGYSQSEQKELIKRYYEIKNQKPKIREVDIAKKLNIGRTTLFRWKKQFKRQQLHPNFVDEKNAA